MNRIIKFRPAFDKRDPDPAKNYGIHCMDMYVVLQGELAAISFTIYTGWHLQHVVTPDKLHTHLCKGNGTCISYHSPVPRYEGQEVSDKSCCWIQGPCYSDGSYIQAEEIFNNFVKQGEDYLWKTLEQWYIDRFGELK